MLNRSNFLIAKLASTDEDANTSLKALYVTPEGTQVTDGRCAVIVTGFESDQQILFADDDGIEPADFFTPFLLDRDSALKVAKAIPKKTENKTARFGVVDATSENNGRVMISVTDTRRQEVLRADKIDAEYPDIAKLIPLPASAKFTVTLDAYTLSALSAAYSEFCKTGFPWVEMSFHGTGKPLRFHAKGEGQEMTAILMPSRSDEPEAPPAPKTRRQEADDVDIEISMPGEEPIQMTGRGLREAAEKLRRQNEAVGKKKRSKK